MFNLCDNPQKAKDPFRIETLDPFLPQNGLDILPHLTKMHHTQRTCPEGQESRLLEPGSKRCNDQFKLIFNEKQGDVELYANLINKTFSPTEFCLIFEDHQVLSAYVCLDQVERHKFK
jgi:hypothetical protein